MTAFPNVTPRPPGELDDLVRIWASPKGWRRLTDINNMVVGIWYLGAAFLFFILAGILALLMRTQLAVANNRLLDQDLYNQIFTMHGTTMMFLFAVPAVEALSVMLLPQMLAARDLPFPRLSAFAAWAYVIGGLVFFSTIFYDMAPSGGWFMYPPLSLLQFSPGHGADFWLLGIGFIEISAIAGAVEIVVGVLRTRPPGMTLARMPIYAWSMLVFAGMIIFAFPAIILATMLLEIERAFGWPFFTAEKGGDPLLWQHLFWFFGHPEVYIIFLPAAGLVSMIVPTMAQRPLIGYRFIIVALIATAFFSFGLWVHHMFTTGIPALSLAFFSAASMAVAIPSGIQVFSWIATIAGSRDRFRITTASLFVMGFLVVFTIGGLTGVMVAMVPFDFQVHDSYFIVAHFHYVLVGGMVFPLFATFYYWMPVVSRKPLSERIGRWVFWLMFAGFNLAFFPMHISGLLGMPRRVWTYPEGLGWETLNLISSSGAYVLAGGILLFVVDLAGKFRPRLESSGNLWGAGTLEWLPSDVYSTRSIPHVASREPLWDQPNLAEAVESGAYYLPNAPTGMRETLVTSPIEARPQYVLRMPGPGWAHFCAAVFTAAFFLLLTVKMVVTAIVCGIIAIVSCIWWAWQLESKPDPTHVHIGANIRLPTIMSGSKSHARDATIVVILVAGALFLSYVFSYLYLWTLAPSTWVSSSELPPDHWPLVAVMLLLIGAASYLAAGRTLAQRVAYGWSTPTLLLLGSACFLAYVVLEAAAHWQTGLRPTTDSYAAMVYMAIFLSAQLVAAIVIMSLFATVRYFAGRLDARRRLAYECTALLAYYFAGQALVSILLVHGFPRLIA
jgi:cytochrome c oxidase subunit I+III